MKETLQRSVTHWLLGMLCAAVSLAGCQKVDAEMDAAAEEKDQNIEFIASLGYDTSDLKKTDDGYLVEGDIWLTNEWIAQAKEQPQTRLTQSSKFPHLVSQQYQNNLYLNIIASPGLWCDQIENAVNEWNKLENCYIKINKTQGMDSQPITITFKNKYDAFFIGTNKLMQITPPWADGTPGTVDINRDCSSLPSDDALMRFDKSAEIKAKSIIMHAIGHALGLGHTPKSSGEFSPNDEDRGNGTINGTNSYDAVSIMTREDLTLSSWSGFSSKDKTDIPKVFPKPTAPPTPALSAGKIEASKTIAHGTTALIINSTEAATGGSGTITYSWEKKSGTSWITVSGQNGASLNTAVPTETTSEYRRKATDGKTTVTSNPCVVTTQVFNPGSIAGTLTIDTENPGEQITVNSTGAAVCPGGVTYTWEINTGASWTVIPGATGASLTTAAPMQFATRYKRKATCTHTSNYTNECLVYNEAFLNPGELAPLVEINKTGFCTGFIDIPCENELDYPGLRYSWEVNTGSGWTNYYGAFNMYGDDTDILQHITKFRRSVSTPQGKKKYTNECTLVNYAFREDPQAGTDFDKPIKLGPYWDSFSETLAVDTRGEYFRDLDQATGGSKDAVISLEIKSPMVVDLIMGGASMYIWLSVFGENNVIYCHYEHSLWPQHSYPESNSFPVFEDAIEGPESDIFTFYLNPGKYNIQLQGIRALNGSSRLNNIIGISIRGNTEP